MATVNGTRFDDVVATSGAGYFQNGVFVASAANTSTAGADTISTGVGDDDIDAAGGDDTVSAGNGDDVVSGGDGADTLNGGNGADDLDGGAGADILNGDNGRDTLAGGAGADTLTGGNGPDTFVLSVETDSSANADGTFNATTGDVITDFSEADSLDVGGLALSGVGAPEGLSFNGSTAAAWSVWTSQSGGNTFVFADLDGDATADVAFRVNGLVDLDATDFAGLGEQADNTDVTAVDDTGTAVEDGIEAGSDASGNVLDNDTEVEDETLTVTGVRAGGSSSQAPLQPAGSVIQGAFGALVLNADGSWTYQVDEDSTAVNALAEGETLTDTFTYETTDPDGDFDTATLTVTIEGANDAPRILGGDTAGLSVVEGDANVAAIAAVDPEGDDLTFSIAGGADAALFAIDEDTGELSFVTAPDFDDPDDADADNVYEVEVEVSDGLGGTDTQAIEVTVTDEDAAVGDENDFDDADAADAPGFAPVFGTAASDDLFGGAGNQALFGAEGNDDLRGGNGDDMLFGQADDDELDGGLGADVLYGGSGDDELTGLNGDDELFGGSGDDTLSGGRGDDLLVGGLGADLMNGGQGADTFVFVTGDDGGDTIQGFATGQDTIDLSAFGLEEGDVSWTTVGNTTTVEVDTDGDSVVDLTFTVQGQGGLQTSDFFL